MKKVFMLLLVVVISVFAVTGCSNEEKTIIKQATVAEDNVEIGGLSNYKGEVALIGIEKGEIKVKKLKISTEDLKMAIRRYRAFAVGLHMENEYDVNFINMVLMKDFKFKSATQDETDIASDYFDRTVGNTSNSYYWFIK